MISVMKKKASCDPVKAVEYRDVGKACQVDIGASGVTCNICGDETNYARIFETASFDMKRIALVCISCRQRLGRSIKRVLP